MSDERELFLKKLSLELQNGLGSSDLTSIVSGEVAKINEYLKKDKGKEFIIKFYNVFDVLASRGDVIFMYLDDDSSIMSFEGQNFQGAAEILKKLNILNYEVRNRIITAIDSQPMIDGGVLINVLGRFQLDEQQKDFAQTFVLKNLNDVFFIIRDEYRTYVSAE